MNKDRSRRLQIDLAARHQQLLAKLGERMGTGSDAETTRRLYDVFENLADQIVRGYKVVVVPPEDEHPDALPEITRALSPASRYSYLVQRPHLWRKQLFFKGRRLTVGQFLHAMAVNDWTPRQAADEFEVPVEAAYEALDYGSRFRPLITAEDAEDARAATSVVSASTAR